MRPKYNLSLFYRQLPAIFTSVFLLLIYGCSSNEEEGFGYIQVYNASSSAPVLYLSVDQYDDDDYSEKIHTSGEYTQSSGYLSYVADTYDIELAWQDDDDFDDLQTIYQGPLRVIEDSIKLIVVAEKITSPNILVFDIPVIDDEDDIDDELFSMRFLNLHPQAEGIDIYYSDSNESFNEAILIDQLNYTEISENNKYDQDSYLFYITNAGTSEILYQSDEVFYSTTSQYVMIIRENNGSGTSPFILDRMSSSSRVEEYPDEDSESEYRVYNGIIKHELLPAYDGVFDLYIDEIDQTAEISSLQIGDFSDSYRMNFGDYSISLTAPASDSTLEDEVIIQNHLLTLNVNSDKSVFFYLLEEDVDEDGDGDVDENGDGYVDEIEVNINSLVVDNSQTKSIYDHEINVINLIGEYNFLNIYFVRSDETIDTADNDLRIYYANPRSLILRNNTYYIYAIAEDNSSKIILASLEISLDESSQNMFLILEEDELAPNGYKISVKNQKMTQ